MKWLAAVSLVLMLLVSGCALFGGQPAPVQSAPEPAPEPQAQPEKPAFDPASLCGKVFGNYENSVFSVRPCGAGNYILYRGCCGQPAAFVDANGVEIAADGKCTVLGENLCAKTAEVEPILCPAYAISSCPDYGSPVCARIVDVFGESWLDYQNDCVACKEGNSTGGRISYVRGECAARGIDTKAVIEEKERAQVYQTLIGKEITLYAQHYGLAGREVKMIIERTDIKYMDKVTYNGQASWRVTVTDFAGNEEHSVYLYMDSEGKNIMGQEQNY
ncbi:MAG: hypothetical protein WC759_00695 [Candidatus Micrarchaeia archaeon]|jgi:hypothetical protein